MASKGRTSSDFSQGPDARLAVAGSQLFIDVVSVEAVAALEKGGVRSILLKGPSLARWLYPEPTSRSYSDCDLLVSVGELEGAASVLGDLGFERESFREIEGDRPLVAHPWIRPRDGATVDLHYGIPGINAPASELWEVLIDATEPMELRGGRVTVLGLPARLMHVVLHAAQHGGGRPVVDLARALEQLPESLWMEAVEVARRLDAIDAFSVGLELLDDGRLLLQKLDLPKSGSVDARLRAGSAPPAAFNIQWFLSRPSLKEKALLIVRKLFPDAASLRARSALARRGPAGLVAAYLWRPFSILIQLGPGFVAWRRARREAEASRR